jgi:DNA processing protein
MNCGTVSLGEPGYPLLLPLISDPPKKLYYIGDLSLASKRCVSVVGSRKTTEYGRWAAYTLAQKLAENGVVVVSGLAAGIDACSHAGALRAPGKTIAVLGCGIDLCYPAMNQKLKEQITGAGLVLSEYPPGYQAAVYTFPRRNRIISGISEATVVAAAGLHSGSLITAELAEEQGRAVYALPGNINNVYHLGSNKLIKDGAIPLVVLDDLLEELGIRPIEQEELLNKLSSDEQALVEQLIREGERTVDQLCKSLAKPTSHVNGLVTVLEMKGILRTSMGKIFVAK